MRFHIKFDPPDDFYDDDKDLPNAIDMWYGRTPRKRNNRRNRKK